MVVIIQRLFLAIILTVLAGPAAFAQNFYTPSISTNLPQGGYHIEYKKVHRLVITYNYSTTWPSGGPHYAKIYLPMPPETGGQHITGFHSNIDGDTISDRSSRRIISAELHKGSGDERYLQWKVQVSGVFRQRVLVSGPAPLNYQSGNSPTHDDLRSTESINWDTDSFQNWLTDSGLRRQSRETNLAFARRAFTYICNHGSYTYPPSTPWNAALSCRRLETDCGGFSLIFTAACRANHVPTHLLVGQWMRTQEYGNQVELTSRQPHVYTEFYDSQIGWIPVDISSALMHVPGVGFGSDPGYFLTWHLDTDLRLATPGNPSELVRWIQNPSPWFSPSASYAAEASRHSWELRGG